MSSEVAKQTIGDHQRASHAGSDPTGMMTLAAAIKIAQQASQPREVSAPPPLTKVQNGPVAQGRYIAPLSIDPRNITAGIENYEEHKGYLQVAADAFSVCHVGLQKLGDAREQIKRDPSKTEAQQVLLLAGEAEKLQSRMMQALDKARTTLVAGIKHNEGLLSTPLKSAADNSISAEVRAYVRNLPDDKRMGFLNDALKRNDVATLSAVLGAQPFLSGLSHEMSNHYTRQYHEKNNPDVAARIGAMREALEKVEQRSGPMLTEVEKCLGADWGIVQKLRKASSATEQALLLVNAPPVQQS